VGFRKGWDSPKIKEKGGISPPKHSIFPKKSKKNPLLSRPNE
jgi:hypothetical protein